MSMTRVYGHNKLVYNDAANDLAKAGQQGPRYIGYHGPEGQRRENRGPRGRSTWGHEGLKDRQQCRHQKVIQAMTSL